MATREEQRQRTRQQLIEAARDVFARRPFDDATVSDIVAEAGTSRGSFYNHFDDKLGCYLAVIDDSMAAMREALRDARKHARSAESFLSDMFHAALEAEVAHARLIPLGTNGPAEVRSFGGESFDRFAHELAEDLQDGVARGVLAPHRADVLANAIVGAVHALAVRMGDDPEGLTEGGLMLARMFLAVIDPVVCSQACLNRAAMLQILT